MHLACEGHREVVAAQPLRADKSPIHNTASATSTHLNIANRHLPLPHADYMQVNICLSITRHSQNMYK